MQVPFLLHDRFPKGVPWISYHGTYKNLQINLVWPGIDATYGKLFGYQFEFVLIEVTVNCFSRALVDFLTDLKLFVDCASFSILHCSYY